MGMIFIARRLTADETATVLDPPDGAAALVTDESGEAAASGRLIDLDKSWHGIHCLLTGTAWNLVGPAGSAILGGEPTGGDLGYGPARLLTPAEVSVIATELAGVDEATLRGRYSAPQFASLDIYPSIWDEDDVFETYLRPNFDALARFYADAAAAGDAVLLVLT